MMSSWVLAEDKQDQIQVICLVNLPTGTKALGIKPSSFSGMGGKRWKSNATLRDPRGPTWQLVVVRLYDHI